MLLPMFYMRDGRTRLRTQLNNIQKEIARAENTGNPPTGETIKRVKNDYYALSLEMMNAIQEILYALDDNTYTIRAMERSRNIKDLIIRSHASLREFDLEQMNQLIENILSEYLIEGDRDLFAIDNTSLYRHDVRSKFFYSSSERFLDPITYRSMVAAIEKGRRFNLIDGTGKSAAEFLTVKESLEGEEYDSYVLNVLERQQTGFKAVGFDRIALGGMKGGTFSNEVFDVLLLNPTISFEKHLDSAVYKAEREAIKDTFKLVRPGGVALITIPSFRMHKDTATQISKLYKNVQIRKSTRNDPSCMLYILAVRKTKEESKEIDPDTFRLLRSISFNEEIKTVYQEDFEPVTLPDNQLEVSQFRGSLLNLDEVKTIFENSSIMDQFFASQAYTHASEQTKEPLLPFTTGQLGLVLTSGNLDGIINEGDGSYHVVKGRVVKDKQVVITENTEEQQVTYQETIANRVEINVITANGTIKRLA